MPPRITDEQTVVAMTAMTMTTDFYVDYASSTCREKESEAWECELAQPPYEKPLRRTTLFLLHDFEHDSGRRS